MKRQATETRLTTPRKKTMVEGDRFIPSRSGLDANSISFKLADENGSGAYSPTAGLYKASVQECLLDGGAKVLAYKTKAPVPSKTYQNSMKVLYSQKKRATSKPVKTMRHIASEPEKILDAPEIENDYYLDLIDWSPNNILAVALGSAVYLWNASTGEIEELLANDSMDNIVTSVAWVEDGSYLAVGNHMSEVQLWDVTRMCQVRALGGHSSRVSSLAWNHHILSTGSRDSTICNHDVRKKEHLVSTLRAHDQEVCGLKWSPDGSQLASGGNDNVVNIYDQAEAMSRLGRPTHTFLHHTAAVKAMDWCPWQSSLLATGGGTSDRTIRFWNTSSGACLNTVDAGSQVCSLKWSRHQKEIMSAHGFAQNQITLWSYPSLVKVNELFGHSNRILDLAVSPDGTSVCSAAGDETLRFWRVWEPSASTSGRGALRKKADSRLSSRSGASRVRNRIR